MTSGTELRRRGIARLAREGWTGGRSVWETDAEGREVAVDGVTVTEEPAPGDIARVLDLPAGAPVCVRSRRYLLDGGPVLLAVSRLPAELVRGTAVTRPDSGPGGIYARLAELGVEPTRFREEVRSRMPSREESERLALGAGTPVMLVRRTACTPEGRAVEVNDMDSAAYVLEYDFGA
ncbi:UTRA domain-containing protein [Streptomyces sp. NPDC002490]|uniref:UTRA domain-containing protein n=1 Tax=Streptomyces sp. NPDC002490 TaxID=3154416 RepID=UPI00331D272A